MHMSSRLTPNVRGNWTVGELMSAPVRCLPARMRVSEAVAEEFADQLFSAFPIVDDWGRAIGLVSMEEVRALSPELRARCSLGSIATHDASLVVPASLAVADLLTRDGFARHGRAVVVDDDGAAVGLITIGDVWRRRRAEVDEAPRTSARLSH